MNEFTEPKLDDYQYRLVHKIRELIDNNFYRTPPNLKILDAGCDTSGKQLWHFGKMTSGEVVGINIAKDFPSESCRKYDRNNVTLLNMNGMDLDFPDQSFDMVISANVIEHIRDPDKYIKECGRILKKTGIAYFETAPLWTSARGHHVHEDMVIENCPDERGYRNDGSIIPDWSHLALNEDEMRSVIQEKLSPRACDYIIWYLYESGDLNRCPFSAIKTCLEFVFNHVSINTWEVNNPDLDQRPKSSSADWDSYGFAAVCRSKQQSAISSRLIWRLRRIGL